MKPLLAIVVLLVGCGTAPQSEPGPADYLTASVVSLSQFDQVKVGMDVTEVKEILGRKGEQTPVSNGIEHVWNNSDGTFVSVRFVDGKAVEKVKFGFD
jgi:hypothetical protein